MPRKILLTTAAISALIVAAQAQAQPTTGAAAQNNSGQIGDIVVTAQKRSESISKVPMSITAVSAAQLTSSASKNLEELQGIVPGVTFPKQTTYGGAPIVIRGTSGQGTFLEDDPVAVYVDGIYQASNSRFGVSDLTDVQSVEIVRGPQGTLQGRNATAGAILIRTVDPGDELSGFVRASLADPLEYRVEGAVSLPVSDTFGIRLAADHFDERGYARNLFNNQHIGGQVASNFRAVLKWEPDSPLSVRLALNYQQLSNRQAAARWAATTVTTTGRAVVAPTPYVSLPGALEDQYLDSKLDLNITSHNKQKSPSAALELHYDLGSVEIVSLTGLSKATNDGTADSDGLGTVDTNGVSLNDTANGQLRQAFNQGHITGNQQTQELRLQSVGNGRFKWLVGLFGSRAFDKFAFDITNRKFTTAINQVAAFRARQVNYSGAIFADGTFKLIDELSVTGGIRYTKESKLFSNSFTVTNLDTGLVLTGPIRSAPPRAKWDDVSYRAGLNYQVTPDTLLYVNYSKGFKSGGFNAFGVGPTPAFNPEKLNSFEAGLKAYFLDRRGYVAISGYSNNYDNLQVTAGVPTGGVIVQNAASAKIKGFEIEGEFKPIDHLTLSGNAAYTDATYSSFRNAQAVGGELVDATGFRLPNTPKWQYFVQADYGMDLTSSWRANLQLSWRWRDMVYFFGTNQSRNLRGEAYGELGGRIELTQTDAQFSVALYARNLLDRRVVASEQVQFAYPVAFFNEPRVVGVALSKKF
ncbi:TonB-dependent receptor [Sphingobium chlorophenolicum]|uniref:TonB-dependent receptor n=1 Tax=Sphingobium chlorophenolicum TaxID=46429 RepID=A0A081REH2_SPHCR|nr:TonB-dependent receptor [Sphingobium chlorophenolicum]KEQ53595.1 TonB-dependent receptor precursor [Sphingobium chlorophenolicum]